MALNELKIQLATQRAQDRPRASRSRPTLLFYAFLSLFTQHWERPIHSFFYLSSPLYRQKISRRLLLCALCPDKLTDTNGARPTRRRGLNVCIASSRELAST
jgi:hypothetical protein